LQRTNDGIIHLFPVWPDGKDASFTRLRTTGAFVVSSARTGNTVTFADITSTAGGTVKLANPWTDTPVTVKDSAGHEIAATVDGGQISFATTKGETYDVRPGQSGSETIQTTVTQQGGLTMSIDDSSPVVLPTPTLNEDATSLVTSGDMH